MYSGSGSTTSVRFRYLLTAQSTRLLLQTRTQSHRARRLSDDKLITTPYHYPPFSFSELENPMTNEPTGSYSFWLAFFYILVFLMAASLGLCVYVAICFKSGSFPYVWPVKLLRAIVSVIFSVLFVSALDVFLVGVACVPATPHSARCVLYNFPTVRFQSLPALVHGVIGIVMSIFSIRSTYRHIFISSLTCLQ